MLTNLKFDKDTQTKLSVAFEDNINELDLELVSKIVVIIQSSMEYWKY